MSAWVLCVVSSWPRVVEDGDSSFVNFCWDRASVEDLEEENAFLMLKPMMRIRFNGLAEFGKSDRA